MPRKRQDIHPLTARPSNISRQTNNRTDKSNLYQSSLEQFLRPKSTRDAKENKQFTTPSNKRKLRPNEVQSIYFTKKRKRSSELSSTVKNYETSAGTGALESPVIVLDDSGDEIWDGDTLINSASTTRTLCPSLKRSSFGSKSKSFLEELASDRAPPTTPESIRSKTRDTPTSSPFGTIPFVVPSSQAQERSSPLVISLNDKECEPFNPSHPPLNRSSLTEVIPSSQSQYLTPYVISPCRVRKFFGKPPSPTKELVPCSQEPLDLVVLARQEGLNDTGSKSPLEATRLTDTRNDGKLPSDQLGLSYEQSVAEDVMTKKRPDEASTCLSQPPAAVRDDAEFLFTQQGTSPSLLSSSLPAYEGDDSEYTFIEETCPSDIREFLDDLEERRTDIEPSQPEVLSRSKIDRTVFQLEENEPSSRYSPDCSLPSMASTSQFSIAPPSQYTFVEASLPSDIAEFVSRLDNSMGSDEFIS